MSRQQKIEMNILVMGAGVTGKAAIQALLPEAAGVSVYDEGDASFQALLAEQFPGVPLYSKDAPPDLSRFDLLLKSPGIAPDHPLLLQAGQEGTEVVSDAELAYRLFPDRQIAGITGTNGKTTTTALLCHIAKQERTVHCLGNIGVGMLPAFFSGDDTDLYVLELSSFQLTHSPTLRTSVCGLLNITPDHINWHGSMEAYAAAKASLLLHQNTGDTAVVNVDDPMLADYAKQARSKVVSVSQTRRDTDWYEQNGVLMRGDDAFFDFSELRIPGHHNRENALVAAAMAHALGISDSAIREGMRSFPGVAHRIEFLGAKDDVSFYNDSKGTNVDASIKAIEALPYPIRLLAGGMDKKISYLPLIERLEGKVVRVYLYGETARLIENTAHDFGFHDTVLCADLEEATRRAFSDSSAGDTVLLSPASASWDMYPNFETRGDHFRKIARELGVEHEAQKN